ncbi:MAG: ACT domain-containing protein [Candidatus Acidiferrales bacterium]
MPIAKQFTVMLENRPGMLAELCTELARLAVNIHALHAETGRPIAAVRMVPSQPEVAKRVFTSMRLQFAEEDVLTVKIGDRPGSLGRVTRKLAEKGINIEYVYGSVARGSTQALIVIGVSDLDAAARVVK